MSAIRSFRFLLVTILCLIACSEAKAPQQTPVVFIPPVPSARRPVPITIRVAPATPTVEQQPAADVTAHAGARSCAWIIADDPMAYPSEQLAMVAVKRRGRSPSEITNVCFPCPFEDCP
jgi:hypothetical protein